jgi:hypothetical protein
VPGLVDGEHEHEQSNLDRRPVQQTEGQEEEQ